MSRAQRRRRGRPYQPLPQRRNPWIARLMIVAVGVLLIFGSLAFLGLGR
jgi:ABC-type dipeptide/oligopeptide/nickel transport system permease subunit